MNVGLRKDAIPGLFVGHAWIHRIAMADAVNAILDMAKSNSAHLVVTPNVDHIVMLENNQELRQAYEAASLSLVDGYPVVLLSRALNRPLPERINGTNLLLELLGNPASKSLRLFLLGGRPDVNEKAAAELTSQFPDVKIVGRYCPAIGFESDETANAEIIARLRTARPQIIAVCLGCPKQEVWINANLPNLPAGVYMGLGSALDLISNEVKRAPRWAQDRGLEWLYRLIQEPARLWHRYLVQDSRFIIISLRMLLRDRTQRETSD